MTITRRTALKALASGAALAATAGRARAENHAAPPDSSLVAMLYDTTLCIGCKACVVACTEANGLTPDTGDSKGMYQQPKFLNDHTKNIIKLYRDEKGNVSYIKAQCMHCIDAACVSACPMHALQKGDRGVVTWTSGRCIGCRYCQIACPFNIPKFEWHEVNPKIVKCEFCNHRFKDGKGPACCEVCPRHAVIWGTREQMLREARKRIADNPGKYYGDRIYGEFEAGGTQVLYLTHINPALLGHLAPLDNESLPSKVEGVQNTLYMGFLSPILAYGVIASVLRRRMKEREQEAQQMEQKTGLKEQL